MNGKTLVKPALEAAENKACPCLSVKAISYHSATAKRAYRKTAAIALNSLASDVKTNRPATVLPTPRGPDQMNKERSHG